MSSNSQSNKKRFIKNHKISPETQMMGYGFDPALSEGALKPPIFMTSTFVFENAEKALSFSSGMSAISTTLLAFLRPGDVIVHSALMYGGSEYLIRNILPEFGIESVEFESGIEKHTLADALKVGNKKGRVGVIFIETPANPTNGLVDLTVRISLCTALPSMLQAIAMWLQVRPWAA